MNESLPSSFQLTIFLCHGSADKPKVRDLYSRLRRDGFVPWFDEQNLHPGQDWHVEIPQAVRASHVVLVCLSQTSVNKEGHVQKEIKMALDVADEKPEGTIYIIPAALETGVRVPTRLSQWKWVNLFQPDGYQKLLGSLQLRGTQIGASVAVPERAKAVSETTPAKSENGAIRIEHSQAGRDTVAVVGHYTPTTGLAIQDQADIRAESIAGRDIHIGTQIINSPPATSPAPQTPLVYLPDFDPDIFIGRAGELSKLQKFLRNAPGRFLLSGEPGSGKSTLAQMCAWQARRHFAAVLYQTCGQRGVDLIAGEMADTLKEQIGEQVAQLPTEQKLRAVQHWLQQRRSLLVLDDVWLEEKPATGVLRIQELMPGPGVSVVVTSRRPSLPWIVPDHTVRVEAFTPAEVEATFRLYLGAATFERHRAALLAFAERMERLPIAVVVGTQLLRSEFGPLDEAARGLELSRLSNEIHDVPGLLERAIQAQGEAERRLLSAAAVCEAEDFWLPLALTAAQLESAPGQAALRHLVHAGLLRLVDRDRQRFHLHALLRDQVRRMEAEQSDSVYQKHAQALEQIFGNWESRWKDCRECLAEIIPAGQRLFAKGETGRASSLLFYGYATARQIGELATALQIEKCKEQLWLASHHPDARDGLHRSYGNQALILRAWGRLEEAMALHKKKEAICEELGNKNSLQVSYGNQALILQAWGRLEEAMALHKKEEAICEELGNKNSLQVSYGNQALILKAWGRLEEAMALHKKQEAICEELGNKDSLQISYGNQAVILQYWGRLEEAMALLKKQEAICEELGNMDSLQRSYGNQALILQDWGRLEEAMAMHRKEEAICEELGNKDGLQISYGNQALILQDWGRLEDAMALHKKKEAICEELGNKDGLQASYGNQALILQDWGWLDEALVLLKKQEAICEELGNKASLGHCYWNWGLLARELKDHSTEKQKLEAALAIFTALKMPRQQEAVQDDLEKGIRPDRCREGEI
jgi:tetratricopeptide (TPR) repeat protein